jgi:hypothetical protein
MLGVRRQTISIIAGTLQKAGLITYRRGVVKSSTARASGWHL